MLAARESGQSMAEYAVVLTAIAVAAIAALLMLGSTIGDALTTVATLI